MHHQIFFSLSNNLGLNKEQTYYMQHFVSVLSIHDLKNLFKTIKNKVFSFRLIKHTK